MHHRPSCRTIYYVPSASAHIHRMLPPAHVADMHCWAAAEAARGQHGVISTGRLNPDATVNRISAWQQGGDRATIDVQAGHSQARGVYTWPVGTSSWVHLMLR